MIPLNSIFRAQSLLDKVFYYGSYLSLDTESGTKGYICFQRPSKTVSYAADDGLFGSSNFVSIPVDPKTLGMCTGLKDCTSWDELSEREQRVMDKDSWNGFLIFDGDVLEATSMVCGCTLKAVSLVHFDVERAMWTVVSRAGVVEPLIDETSTWEEICYYNGAPKVVGNIYDNANYEQMFSRFIK